MKQCIGYFSLVMMLCTPVSLSQESVETIYPIAKSRPNISLPLTDSSIRVVNIYKAEIMSVYESTGKDDEERISQFVRHVYLPHRDFWDNFFDEDGFRMWARKNWGRFQTVETPGLLIPFHVDFDSLFAITVGKMKNLTSYSPGGVWYLVYGNKASNIGGFYNGNMFVDFFGIGNKGTADLIFSLPHEINHQIYSGSAQDNGTLLHTIIDEGFACYVNYLYWEKKHSPAKNISFTDEEWAWCVEHEKEIFNHTKTFLDSTDREIIRTFQSAHRFIFDGAPDRIAYFIGFRICQAYVARHGEHAWKEIYSISPAEVLRKSDYAENVLK